MHQQRALLAGAIDRQSCDTPSLHARSLAPGRRLARQQPRWRYWVQSKALARMPGSNACPTERTVPSPLAGHATSTSVQARWRHPCRQRSRKLRGHRTRQLAGSLSKSEETASRGLLSALFAPSAPTISTGPYPPTVAGPYAAWMLRKSLRSVFRDGGRARALPATLPTSRSLSSPLGTPTLTAECNTPDPSLYGVSNSRLLR
ncbi:UNVERIFIED_ORG: hypothetical protein ABIB63_004162 [Xanthomonas axonopodis]